MYSFKLVSAKIEIISRISKFISKNKKFISFFFYCQQKPLD